MRPLVACVLVILWMPGCGPRRPPTVAASPSDPGQEGRTSYRALAKPSTSEAKTEVSGTITAAYPSDQNRPPDYPPHALKAGCQQGLVPIRLYVDAEGQVAKAGPIPDRPVKDDPCHSAFWAVTWSAVQGWRFAPAFRLVEKPGPDRDGDGVPDFSTWEQTPIMVYLDFEFAFTVVGGKGRVLAR